MNEILKLLMAQMELLHEMSAICDDEKNLCELCRTLVDVGRVAVEFSQMDATGYVPTSLVGGETRKGEAH